ncbi:MAG: PspA-associated protein PspAB [Mycobacteriales bacterium]
MGFLDVLLGRTKPVPANLDALFALPAAGVGLQAATGLAPTGVGAVCIKPAEGAAFTAAQTEVTALLRLDEDTVVDQTRDDFGYLWTTARTGEDRLADVVTALHAANTTYERAGFSTSLLCSLVGFAGAVDGRRASVGLVYLYKRGTTYPFAPLGGEKRDTALELRVRAALGEHVRVEPDLSRWFPVWGAPGP